MGELSFERPKAGHGRLIQVALNRVLTDHCFLQLFRDFDYLPRNGGWPFNRWPLNGGASLLSIRFVIVFPFALVVLQEEKINYEKICEEALREAKSDKRVLLNKDWLDSPWKGFFKKGYTPSLPVRPTGIPLDTLKHIGKVFSTSPGGDFKIHGGKKDLFQFGDKIS